MVAFFSEQQVAIKPAFLKGGKPMKKIVGYIYQKNAPTEEQIKKFFGINDEEAEILKIYIEDEAPHRFRVLVILK